MNKKIVHAMFVCLFLFSAKVAFAEQATSPDAATAKESAVGDSLNSDNQGASTGRGGKAQPGKSADMNKVADVSVYSASIISQDNNKFKLSFDLYNGDNIQPQVVYSVGVIDAQSIGDQKVYSQDVLSIGSTETIHREVEYAAPEFFSGKYALYVEARNLSGLPLARVSLGEVDLSGSEDGVLLSSCYLAKQGDTTPAKQEAFQLLDVEANDTLIAHCDVSSKKKGTAIPFVENYYKTVFGKSAGSSDLSPINISTGDTKNQEFIIQKPTEPQIYVASLALKDQQGNIISNSVRFIYSVHGLSVTIDNVTINKNSYNVGDLALVSMLWSTSANFIPDPQKEKVDLGDAKLKASLFDGNGNLCGGVFEKNVTRMDQGVMLAKVDVDKACIDPNIRVEMLDSNGAVLARNEFSVKSSVATQQISGEKKGLSQEVKGGTGIVFKIVLAVLVVLVVVLIGWYVYRKRKFGLGFFVILLCVNFFFINKASAATFENDIWIQGYYSLPIVYTWQTDKASYSPGEQIALTGSAVRGYTIGGGTVVGIGDYLSATINGNTQTIFNNYTGTFSYCANGGCVYDGYWTPLLNARAAAADGKSMGTKYFSADAAPGSRNASLKISSDLLLGFSAGYLWYANDATCAAAYNIPYTVVNKVATPAFSPPAGTYPSAQNVAITSVTAGASIYYTTDGSTPTASSTSYTAPVAVSLSKTIKAIAVKAGLGNSDVASAAYVISKAATPTFSPPAGTYPSAQNVAIASVTAGASIYYTTDGSTPAASSALYVGPVAVSSSTTLKAIAVKAGMGNSDVASAAYVISCSPTYLFSCTNPSPDCTGHDGETRVGIVACTRTDSVCGGGSSVVFPSTTCGVDCIAKTINCPSGGGVGAGAWKEVAP